jgi:plasmid stabilization system protein ParE
VILFTDEALDDLLRLDQAAAGARDLIRRAVMLLGEHPFVGRTVEHGLRELVISRGKTGYLALYDYDESADEVIVLAVRHQREAGY